MRSKSSICMSRQARVSEALKRPFDASSRMNALRTQLSAQHLSVYITLVGTLLSSGLSIAGKFSQSRKIREAGD